MEYYENLYKRDYDDTGLLHNMPSSLKVQMAVTLNADFLRGVPYFADLDVQIIATMVLCLHSRVYLPSETVIQQGDVSKALYFVRSGSLQVIKESAQDAPEEVLGVLAEYATFGEQSFLMGIEVKATVRTSGYAEIMRLLKSDFEGIVEMFPKLRVHMAGVQRRLQE
eukprot:4588145-Prymnesium_polylepis.1